MTKLLGRLLAVGAVACLVAACRGDGSGSPDTQAAVAAVEVTPAQATVTRGETVQLRATLTDGAGRILQARTVTWTSDDPSRVSVTAMGLVTAVGNGRVIVKATAEGKSDQTEITVVDPPATVSRVSLSSVNVTLREGESEQLTATAYDAGGNVIEGRAVQWISSNPGIALVSPAGRVTGLKPGTVSITAVVEGAQASSTIKIFAEYEFALIFAKAGVAAAPELHLLDINDPAATAQLLFPPGMEASQAMASPDGRKIAFVVVAASGQSTIYVANRDGSGLAPVCFLPGLNESPAWSPDGTRIAFTNRPPGGAADVWVMQADGSDLVNLTADQSDSTKSSPAWSPALADSSYRIAYGLARGGSSHLWTMRADGSDKRQLTSGEGSFDDDPSWSPDGGSIVFQRTAAAIFGDLYIVASSGGGGRALIPAFQLPYGQFSPAWSPDGQVIAFISKHGDGEHYQVWTVRPDGTGLAQRTEGLQQHSGPAWIDLL